MNLSSHIKKQRKDLRESLEGNKAEIISKLFVCVQNAEGLLGGQICEFWEYQMAELDAAEIPMTSYGLDVALSTLKQSSVDLDNTRNTLYSELMHTCEQVISYANENEQCCMQGDFRFFYDKTSARVVKESELGVCVDLNGAEVLCGSYDRIAKISELNTDKSELVL